MHSDPALTPLRDMLYHLDLAPGFVRETDFPSFEADLRTVFAVTRCLEIISEASRRLPGEIKERHPSIAWNKMAAAGNVYRHNYEDVAAQFIWDTTLIALPPLRVVIESELKQRNTAK